MVIYILPKWWPYLAVTIFPFVLVKRNSKLSRVVRNHERIHIIQQIEMLFIFFFLLYLLEFVLKLIRYRKWSKAYRAISFEKEAYANQDNLEYLVDRKAYSWVRNIFV